MDNSKNAPTVLSLCSGYGGIELGLERAIGKINVLAHVEIEAFAIANLVAKMETGEMDPTPIWTNLKTLPVEPFRGNVDILTGGYPCQPFSHAGKRKGTDDPRHLWPHIRRLVRTIRPRLCFFENVEGHISLGLSTVISDLEADGYRTTWGIFSASEVSAPHRRKRIFILAKPSNSRIEGMFKWKKHSFELGIPSSHGCFTSKIAKSVEERNDRDKTGTQITSELERSNSLADSKCIDAQRERSNNHPEGRKESDGQAGLCSGAMWPAPPGSDQYKWEQPRTVQSTPGPKPTSFKNALKPELGGTAYGPSSRVDRLRLLGNGVVPQTAEKAFLTLMSRLF